VRDIVRRFFPDDSPAELQARCERKEVTYRRIYAPHLQLLPGCGEFLEQTRERQIPLALATAGDWINIEFTLQGLGIRDLFTVIIGGEDVRHGKPHPEVFLKAADALEIAPEDCLVFEDSTSGVEAARRAGMKCIVVNAMTPREDFGETDHVLHFARDYFDLELQTAAV
jgi:HAD superfamily hydrolase (TIGR01509 family)